MFYKRIFAIFIALGLAISGIFLSGQVLTAKADVTDAHDEYFLEFVREDTGCQDIDYSYIQLYDASLNLNGRQYVFEVNGVTGYALTAVVQMGSELFYEVEELFYNKPAPFVNYQGLPVYVTFTTYLDYVDGVFYDLANNRAVVSQDTVDEFVLNGFGFKSSGDVESVDTSETISFATRTTDAYTFPYEAPNLYGSVNGSCCANNAGAVVISYYDRFFENLIPNYQTYRIFLNRVIYYDFSPEMSNVVETLHAYMAVEGIPEGTTFTGFQQGMRRYVQEKGYTYSTTSLMNWGALNYEAYKGYVEQEIPVAIFLNGFTMSGVGNSTEQDLVNNFYYAATHVEVGIGYKTDTYYNSAGNVITTRKYLRVVSGLFDFGIGYLNISSNVNTGIVNAIAIQIS